MICLAAVIWLVAMSWGVAEASPVSDAVKLFQDGKVEAATAQFEKILADAPGELAARYWLARCKHAQGDLEGAAADLQAVLEQKPKSAESRYWLGAVRREQGRVAEAREIFAAVLAIDPAHAQAKADLAEVKRFLGEQVQDGQPTDDWVLTTPDHGVAVQVAGLNIGAGDVEIFSNHVHDYTFADAPTDWTVDTGLWEITSRWTCSPQWSWFGGFETDGIASVWSKRQFEGDISVEAYMGFKMGVAQGTGSYRNPSDMNITICGDGANLDSGYSFIYGGELNSATRIVRGTKVLAETREDAALLPVFEDGYPSTYEFHRKWWGLRVRKTGDLLQLYVDDKLMCEARDPDPLPGGRVAIWARDNGLIVSRVKIYFERERVPRDPTPTEHLAVVPVEQVAPREVALTLPDHPAIEDDFETDLGSWRNRNGAQGATLTLAAPGADGRGHCLKLINTHAGGQFSATIYQGRLDVRELPQLSFDYRLPVDAKLNLYLTVGEQLYEIVFCGRSDPSPMAQILGTIEGVQADGEWHHASFDLVGQLERRVGVAGTTVARDLFIGNLNDGGYLDAGFGGNHAGTSVCIDNFRLDKPGGREIQVAAKGIRGVKPTGYAFCLDRKSDTGPELKVTSEDGTATLTADADGIWYLHACPQLGEETWGKVVTRCVRVDTSAPRVIGVAPEGGVLTDNAPVSIRVSDAGGVGIDPSSIQVRMGDKQYRIDGKAIVYDAGSEEIRIVPSRAGIVFPQAGKLRVELITMADRNGLALAEPASWVFNGGPNTDKGIPEPPLIVIGDAQLMCDSFESDLGEWEAWGGEAGAMLSRDATTAAVGKYSLKLYNAVSGGTYGAYIRKSSFDAGKYRLVRFHYKVPEHLRADFIVYVNGTRKTIRFTDSDASNPTIGQVPDVRADNEWHLAEFNLYEMLRRDDPRAPGYKVHQFLIADTGWTANAPGQTYHLDEFELVPISSAAQPLRISWQLSDLTGLGGVNWAINEDWATDLDKKALTTSDYVEYQDDGVDGWLHVRACDSAGHWSPTAHRRIVVDSVSPVATQDSPAPGAQTAVSEIRLGLSDAERGGVDPGSVILSVGGTDYSATNSGLTYRSDEQMLVWNCEQVSPTPVVFGDGLEVKAELKQAADYAGNEVEELPQWTWQMDYSKDRTPPPLADITCRTHESRLVHTFEAGLDGWRNRGGEQGAKVERDTTDAGSGEASVKLTQQRKGGHMQAVVTSEAFPAEKFPVISFDYRFDKGVTLNLQLQMAGRWWPIAMTDAQRGAVGRISGMKADGNWHHASINMAPLLRRQRRQGQMVVEAIIIGDRDDMDNPKGASASFDNFVVGRVGSTNPVFRWKATDTTGITGYSYVLDQEPATVPPAEAMGTELAKTFTDLEKGLWFLHIRAVDGAGNWGPTSHYAIMHAG